MPRRSIKQPLFYLVTSIHAFPLQNLLWDHIGTLVDLARFMNDTNLQGQFHPSSNPGDFVISEFTQYWNEQSCETVLITQSLDHLTRGHNIVADGWARASNPYLHPNPYQHTPTYTIIIYEAYFSIFAKD